ncbi:hypothetical protein Nos7524_5554 [Nostoc sp. PCC 7524]|nr:hypothetical protein Nos7524_5554 [Nostoc sp. PCC 7524]
MHTLAPIKLAYDFFLLGLNLYTNLILVIIMTTFQ